MWIICTHRCVVLMPFEIDEYIIALLAWWRNAICCGTVSWYGYMMLGATVLLAFDQTKGSNKTLLIISTTYLGNKMFHEPSME